MFTSGKKILAENVVLVLEKPLGEVKSQKKLFLESNPLRTVSRQLS